jgi:hypothetical protein
MCSLRQLAPSVHFMQEATLGTLGHALRTGCRTAVCGQPETCVAYNAAACPYWWKSGLDFDPDEFSSADLYQRSIFELNSRIKIGYDRAIHSDPALTYESPGLAIASDQLSRSQ